MTTLAVPVPSLPTRARNHRTAGRARWAAPLVVALILAACGGAAAPTPAPTIAPTAAAVPSPTPFDVGAAFLAIVGDSDFSAKLALDGSIQMGLTAEMTGTIEGSGDDSKQRMTIKVGPVATTTESISVGGKSWTRTLPGPWLLAPPKTTKSTSLTDWLSELDGIEDVGVETKHGQSLHHLRPRGGSEVPAGALGLDSAQFADAKISIEMYAKDDGTPALFEVTGSWVQTVNGQELTVSLAIDMTISNVGSSISIKAPDDVWTPYTSALGYSVAHPAGFVVVPDQKSDTYQSEGADWFYVAPIPEAKGLSPEGFRDAIIAGYVDDLGAPRDTPTATSVGGKQAYRTAFAFDAEDGTALVLVDVLVVNGDLGWEISFVTSPTTEADEIEIFDAFLATFKFGA